MNDNTSVINGYKNTITDNCITKMQNIKKRRDNKRYEFSDKFIETKPFNDYYYINMRTNDILSRVKAGIEELGNRNLQKQVKDFVKIFTLITSSLNNRYSLPALNFSNDEDTVFLEWNFKDFRIGLTIGENERDSGWFILANRNVEEDDFSASGSLPSSRYEYTIKRIIKYVLENT